MPKSDKVYVDDWNQTGFLPLIHSAVYEPLQLVLEVLLGCVLTGLSTWQRNTT